MIEIKPIANETDLLDEAKRAEPQRNTPNQTAPATGQAVASEPSVQAPVAATAPAHSSAGANDVQYVEVIKDSSRLAPANYILGSVHACIAAMYAYPVIYFAVQMSQIPAEYSSAYTGRDFTSLGGAVVFGLLSAALFSTKPAMRGVALLFSAIGILYLIVQLVNVIGLYLELFSSSVNIVLAFVGVTPHLMGLAILVITVVAMFRRDVVSHYK